MKFYLCLNYLSFLRKAAGSAVSREHFQFARTVQLQMETFWNCNFIGIVQLTNKYVPVRENNFWRIFGMI